MGKKILLADDSITIQKVIELTFSDEDFEVVTVGNGRLAVERVTDVRPDIVLCDIIMPEKDGYEVCDFIKKNPALSHIPVLLLTGAFEPFDQERAARVGSDGFLAKPFEPQTLIAKVKDLLAKSAAARGGATTAFRTAPAPAPPMPATPAPMASAPAPAPFSSAPPWAAPTPPPAPAPMAAPPPPPPAPEPEPEPEAVELDDEPDLPTMVSKPGAYSTASMFDDRPPGSPSMVPPPELSPVTPEESATLGGADREDDSATAVYQPGRAPWSQQTIEVPLEMRAQAGVQAQSEAEPLFEEVFDEPPPPPPPPAASPSSYSSSFADEPEEVFEEAEEPWPSPAPPPVAAPPPPFSAPPPPFSAPPPSMASTPPAAPLVKPWTTPSPSESFADLSPAAPAVPAAPASQAAEVSVPPDMVEKIAQRVVAQISEKVVREVAWEVIPDLAEALIKKEIERLRAELQRT